MIQHLQHDFKKKKEKTLLIILVQNGYFISIENKSVIDIYDKLYLCVWKYRPCFFHYKDDLASIVNHK